MLKGRGKAAKPTFKPRARPTPSSAKPSVEPQAHPPTPIKSSQEYASVPQQENNAAEVIHSAAPQVVEASPQVSTTTPSTEPASVGSHYDGNSKGNETQEEHLQPPANQGQSGREQASVPARQPEISPSQAAITDTTNAQVAFKPPSVTFQKRKAADDELPERPSKRISLGPETQQESLVIPRPTNNAETPASSLGRSSHAQPLQPIEMGRPQEPSNDRSSQPINPEHPGGNVSQISPEDEEMHEAPQYRYPSPDNMAGMAGDVAMADDVVEEGSNPVNMGPAGGAPSSSRIIGDGAGGARHIDQTSEDVPMASLNPDGTSGGLIEEVVSGQEAGKGRKKGKTTIRRRRVLDPEEEVNGRATVEMQLTRTRRAARPRKPRKKKDGSKQRRQRADTPEGASDEEIDKKEMTMGELCKDLKIGKKFSKHYEIKKRLQDKKLEALKEKMVAQDGGIAGRSFVGDDDGDGDDDGGENQEAAAEEGEQTDALVMAGAEGSTGVAPPPDKPTPDGAVASEEPRMPNVGPTMRLVNGLLVLNESSLQIDRHAQARADQHLMREVVEDDFSRVFTSGTYMKREKATPWDGTSTDMFYYCISRCGTDFTAISQLMPHKTRRQIKLKFNKEERSNPEKITRYLVVKTKETISDEDFEKYSGKKLEETADIIAEHEAHDAEMRADMNRIQEERAEITRQQKDAIMNSSAAARAILDGEASDDEDVPKRNKGGRPKKKVPKTKKRLREQEIDNVMPSIEVDLIDEHGFRRTF